MSDEAEMNQAWDNLDPSAAKVSLEQFEKLCEDCANKYAEIKEMEDQVDAEKKELTAMKNKVLEYMNQLKKSKYSANAASFSVSDKLSVKVPKTPEDKALFFNWLKKEGLYDSLVTVNSQTLNSLYNEEFKRNNNADFEIPGVGKASYYQTLNMRRK